ncbi:WGxxGxxG family protein [Rhodococcus sp. NCIMB 12038]|uniref:WGxxGxxG family protein n=1 Tax=Rhodococcus sp. NCIMB 12038 TaxID=933800 RepID=UPI000B3CCDCD|nr:WGxxGxxG family protein [Rhodococcus sp. NCIMB 12038]OUS95119.1 hypothetical protein CA951_13745 [Rhodococcus sp. NCIMB 12038]
MRKTVIATLAATTLAFTGAGLAHAGTPTPTGTAVVAQADNDSNDDGDNTGLWGLLGLVGLLGLAGLKRRNTTAAAATGTAYGTDPNHRP